MSGHAPPRRRTARQTGAVFDRTIFCATARVAGYQLGKH
jgi:hypothetical protein